MAKIKYFKRATSDIDGDIILSADQFRVLALIDENKEIGLIARESGMDLAGFKKCLAQLYEMGLIIPVVKKIIQRYGPEFLQELISTLTYYVGPVANIIVGDVLSDMNIADRRIPVNSLGALLSKITQEIPDLGQKTEFNKMVGKLLLRT